MQNDNLKLKIIPTCVGIQKFYIFILTEGNLFILFPRTSYKRAT